MKESLDFILKEQKELSVYSGIAALLGWDQMTYMPPGGASDRSEHSALISRLSHEKVVSDVFWNHIEHLTQPSVFNTLSEKDQIILRRLRKDVDKSRKIPSSFVEKMAKATTIAYSAWEKAREKNNFSVFAPHLREIVELEQEYCHYIDMPGPRYNCLLDDYEEGMTVDILRREFSTLKKHLVDILEKIKASSRYQKQESSNVRFDVETQKKLTGTILEKMGLPKHRSRIDVSTHPFTTSMGYDDVRITTSYKRKNPLFSFFSTVHEAGHALYELNMPKNEYKDTVISDSPSLGLHESQSRFWENMIARSKDFWQYFYPVFKKQAPKKFNTIDLEKWYQMINRVQPSLIRVEADELTYCLHVILRFEIEVELMEETCAVDELPVIWNEKMDAMLGMTPKNDVEGVLQDMHWSGGSIGYFPTYAIGSIYSSQLFRKIQEELPTLRDDIQRAEFYSILDWLVENIHSYGRKYTADEIITKACGEGLNSRVFIDYLKEKYFSLYEV
jgi:carboxypeptidase Taq